MSDVKCGSTTDLDSLFIIVTTRTKTTKTCVAERKLSWFIIIHQIRIKVVNNFIDTNNAVI